MKQLSLEELSSFVLANRGITFYYRSEEQSYDMIESSFCINLQFNMILIMPKQCVVCFKNEDSYLLLHRVRTIDIEEEQTEEQNSFYYSFGFTCYSRKNNGFVRYVISSNPINK